MSSERLHAVLSPVLGHVGQVGGSSIGVVEEHGSQAGVAAVKASRDENPSFYGAEGEATQGPVQWLYKAARKQ